MGCTMILHSEKGYSTSYAPEQFFTLKREAIQLDKRLKLQLQRENVCRDERTLDQLIDIWYRLHGKTLKDHIRLRKLLYRMSERLGNPIAYDFSALDFSAYREERTKEITI